MKMPSDLPIIYEHTAELIYGEIVLETKEHYPTDHYAQIYIIKNKYDSYELLEEDFNQPWRANGNFNRVEIITYQREISLAIEVLLRYCVMEQLRKRYG